MMIAMTKVAMNTGIAKNQAEKPSSGIKDSMHVIKIRTQQVQTTFL
jgi:hypothetical protein